jgi:serine/threonine-protein kinase
VIEITADLWPQISRCLDEVLDLPPEQVEPWLQALQQHSPRIAESVRSLLKGREGAGYQDFLSVGAALLSMMPGDVSFVGRQIGPYVVKSELGRGGMGSVWLAQRSDGQYERRVAIKFLTASGHARAGHARFQREGSLLARLDHPNIARLMDAGITEAGEPYLVLEYVEGERLDGYCDSASLDVTARVTLFLDVLSAVAHAHRNLIVHRDIKPANVLVTRDGFVKLLDFGISRLTQQSDELPTQSTVTAMTPEYAAPEQLLGEPVTTLTDVYALGVMLYVLLTGQHPFSMSTRSPADLVRRATKSEVVSPSAVTSTALRRALQGDLDNIVLKALRKTPAERYESVGAFAADLRRFLNNEPVSARADSIGYRVGKFIRRHRASVAASALVVAALIVATVVTTTQMLEARRQRDAAQYQSRRAESVSDFLDLLLLSDGGPDRPALTTSQRIDAGVRMLEKQYGDDPAFAGRMLIHLGSRLGPEDDTHSTAKLYERAYELGQQASDPELMAHAECGEVQVLARADVSAGVIQKMADARRLLERVRTPELEVRIQCLIAEGQLENRRSNRDIAATLLLQATDALERAHKTRTTMYSSALASLGSVYLNQNKLAQLIDVSKRAALAQEELGSTDTSDYLALRQNIAVALTLAGEVRESLAEREEINKRVHRFDAKGQEPLPYAINYALALLRMERPEGAEQALAGTVERARTSGNQAMLIQSLHATAWTHIELGRWAQATAALDDAGNQIGQGLGNRNMLGQIEMRKAQVALALKDLPAARQHVDRALKIAGYRTDKAERILARALVMAADVAMQQGVPADAAKFASDSLAISEPVARSPDSSADVAEGLLRLAKATIALGAPQQARPILERALRCMMNGFGSEHPLTIETQTVLATLR